MSKFWLGADLTSVVKFYSMHYRIRGIGPLSISRCIAMLGITKKSPTGALKLNSFRSANLSQLDTNAYYYFGLVQAEHRRMESELIKFLIKIHTYRGFCHLHHLPVHGQRTKTNSATQKRLAIKRISSD